MMTTTHNMRQRGGVVAVALLALAGWAAAYTPCTEPCPAGCAQIPEVTKINGQFEEVCSCTGCPEVLSKAPLKQQGNPDIESQNKTTSEESANSEDTSKDESADAATADAVRTWAGFRIIRINGTHVLALGTATHRSVYIATAVAFAGWLGLFAFAGLSAALYCKWQETQKELDAERGQDAQRLVLGNAYGGTVSKPLGMSSTMAVNPGGADESQSGWM
jgi:hypothetical protein